MSSATTTNKPTLASLVAELQTHYPNLPRKRVIAGLDSWGAKGQSRAETAIQMLHQLEPENPAYGTASITPQSGGSSGRIPLPRGRGGGDVFAHVGTTLGHAGLWASDTNYAIHATGEPRGNGKFEGVVRESRSQVLLYRNASELMWVNTSATVRNRAVSFAQNRVGYAYNFDWFRNKKIYDSVYNCSQLVWAAYKTQGIELDGGTAIGNSFVSPQDIIQAAETTTYKRL